MTPLYLLDTNTASYVIKGNKPAVRRRLAEVPMARVAISAVTEGELLYGVARLPGATRLQAVVYEFLVRVTVFAWDSEAARQYGLLRAALEEAGETMGNLDTMIAAHAQALRAVLVTHDRAFTRMNKLTIEDWTKP